MEKYVEDMDCKSALHLQYKTALLKSYSYEMTEGPQYLVVFSDFEIQSTQPI